MVDEEHREGIHKNLSELGVIPPHLGEFKFVES